MECWSVPHIMSFNMWQSETYLGGKWILLVWHFINNSDLSGLCGETIMCEDGMLQCISPCFCHLQATTLGVCFLKGWRSQRLLEKKKNMRLLSKEQKDRKMNDSTRCVWKWHASWCVQKATGPFTMSTFQESRKTAYFLASLHFTRDPQGLKRVVPKSWIIFTAEDRTPNETLHLCVVNKIMFSSACCLSQCTKSFPQRHDTELICCNLMIYSPGSPFWEEDLGVWRLIRARTQQSGSLKPWDNWKQ